jgi:hypothetical protein
VLRAYYAVLVRLLFGEFKFCCLIMIMKRHYKCLNQREQREREREEREREKERELNKDPFSLYR